MTAVDDPRADFQVQVFPNPTAALLQVETAVDGPAYGLELSDAHGRLLLQQKAAQQRSLHTLDLSGYAPGLYLLRLYSADQQTIRTFKIIKHN